LQIIPKYTQGSVRDSLSFNGLSSMKIHLPSIDEQEKLARVLDLIDQKIYLIKKEIELCNNQKNGLMQQLLTGKIRVKESGEEDYNESRI
jgi:type I restriction enzyme S subunit